MDIRSIKNEADYRATLLEIKELMLAEAGSPEGDRLDVLVTLVEAYERQNYPIMIEGLHQSSSIPAENR